MKSTLEAIQFILQVAAVIVSAMIGIYTYQGGIFLMNAMDLTVYGYMKFAWACVGLVAMFFAMFFSEKVIND